MVCTFEKKIFENIATGYCVAAFKTDDEASVPQDARSKYVYKDKKIRFTAVGYGIPATDSIDLELEGKWQTTKYGVQLVIEHFAEIIPASIEGIISYLSSGLIAGVSEITARKITDRFGLDSLSIIENEPTRLAEIKGLSDKKIEKIVNSYAQNKSLRNIVSFLSPFGITLNKAVRIHERYGDKAMEVLNERPFELCDISGFGFKTVDSIARKIKCKPNDKMRIKAAAKHIIGEMKSEGHVFMDQQELRDKCFDLLNDDLKNISVTHEEIRESLIELIRAKTLVNNNGCIYSPYMFKAEVELAKMIAARTFVKSFAYPNLDSVVESAQKRRSIMLSNAQSEAVKMCFRNNFSVITGGPGTGKSTVLKVVIDVYKALTGRDDILLAAPTGKAAKRMAECTGIPGARTIHSALALNTDEAESDVEIEEGLVVIDETSMVDLSIAYKLMKSIGPNTRIVFVGDADQLPSVGAGNVFFDILRSECVPVTRLDTVFRQSGTSRIALNAEQIRLNGTKLLYGSDFNFISADSDTEALEILKHCYLEEVDANGIDNVQVLAPFRARGETSVKNINEVIREIINPFTGEHNELFCDGNKMRLNDKVIQLKNVNGINNGDVGFIKSVYRDEDEMKHAIIEFSDGVRADYAERDLEIIDLAYAMTIHKSQGTECSTVIIPIMMSHYIMLKRNLIYTAITRAKKKVILIGEKRALMAGIHKNDSTKRNTQLAERIKMYVDEFSGKDDTK